MDVYRNEPAPGLTPQAYAGGIMAAPQEPDGALIDVLVLDDSQFDAMQLQRECRLTDLPVRVAIATTIEQFRAMLHKRHYHLVFIDYLLPDGDGLSARRLLKDADKNVTAPVVMISGEARHDVAVQAMKDGCIDYKSKDELNRGVLKGLILRALEEGSKAAQGSLTDTLEAHRRDIVSAMRDMLHQEMARGAVALDQQDPERLMEIFEQMQPSADSGETSWGDLLGEDTHFIWRKH